MPIPAKSTLGCLAMAVFLSGCGLSLPTSGPAQATRADRIAAECALLANAAQAMSAPHAGLLEGCPGVEARDTRPLRVQTASLRAAAQAELPANVEAGSHGEVVFRRMITRGVPVPVAADLATSREFRQAAALSPS